MSSLAPHSASAQSDASDGVCFLLHAVQAKGFELEKPEKLWEIGGSEWCAPFVARVFHARIC